MKCIAIESTAHTFGCSVVDGDGNVLSDVRDAYKTDKGGMIPMDVAKHHVEVKDKVIGGAIEQSGQKKFDLVSFSCSPGIPPCLKVGIKTAKELARKLNVPLIGVNHCVSHLTSGLLFTGAGDPVFLFCSGANTQIVGLEGGKYRIFGEAISIAIGNMLDKFGREIGFGFPAGPKIEEYAKKGKNFIELPYVVKGMDIELSGILTKAIQLYRNGVSKEDLCYSLQETVFAMLAETSERALAHTGKKELLLIGGVAANKRFGEMLNNMCEERGAKFFTVSLKYSADNAAMIAWQGILERDFAVKPKDFDSIDINPRQRTDQVEVSWK
ncbi:UGMP family protein [Candidatus Pacearchaeota archaeon]|nr:UGMP family protein [Candidatus Pacearchaeota archaeon]|tara:strand:- start:1447 stop:2424 length:978 start_codon:yes stop_codon:yes gene_type:complete